MKRVIYFFVSLTFVGLMTHAHAASFDCSKAKSFAETTICKSPQLSKDDDDLKLVFSKAKGYVQDRKAFSEITKTLWNSRERCSDYKCVDAWYDTAFAIYGAIAEKGIPETNGANDIVQFDGQTKEPGKNNSAKSDDVINSDKKAYNYVCTGIIDSRPILVIDYGNKFRMMTSDKEIFQSVVLTTPGLHGSMTGTSKDGRYSYIAIRGSSYIVQGDDGSLEATNCKQVDDFN